MKATCPKCKTNYELNDSQYGTYFVCIECGAKFEAGVTRRKSGAGKVFFVVLLLSAAFAAILYFVLKSSKDKTQTVSAEVAKVVSNDPEFRYKEFCSFIRQGENIKLGKFVTAADFTSKKFDVPLLHVAIKEQNSEAVKILVSAGADVHESGTDGIPLTIAASSGNLEILKYLHQQGAGLTETFHRKSALSIAAERGDVDMVRYILGSAKTLKEPAVEEKAIFIAMQNRKADCVRELLGYYDTNVTDQNGNTLLLAAVFSGDFTIFSMVKKLDLDLSVTNDRGESVMFAALKSNQPAILAALSTEKVDSDYKNYDGVTLPMVCAQSGNLTWLKKLLSDKNKNARDKNGRNLLFYAVSSGNRSIIDFVASSGVKNTAEHIEQHPFYAALCNGDLYSCRRFAVRDINVTDSKGNTPLMIASEKGYEDVTEWLLSQKCNLNIRNSNGKNAHEIAVGKSHTEVAAMIRKAMRKEEYGILAGKASQIIKSGNSAENKINSLEQLKKTINDNPEAVQYIDDRISALRSQETDRQTEEVAKAITSSSKMSSENAISCLERAIKDNPWATNLNIARTRLGNYRTQYKKEQARIAEIKRRRAKINNMSKSELQNEISSFINSWLSDMKRDASTESYWSIPSTAKTFFSVKSWEIVSTREDMRPWAMCLKVLVESSTKGGSPIRNTWSIFISRQESTLQWKIDLISK